MKTSKFGIISVAMSLLVLICTFVLDFIKVTPFVHPQIGIEIGENVTAWNTFSGGDEVVAKGIQEGSSAGTFIIIAMILLTINIAIQLFKSGKIARLANAVVSIATAVIFLVVAILICGSDKLNNPVPQAPQLELSFNPSMTFGTYLIVALCAAMFFVPKMLSKKK